MSNIRTSNADSESVSRNSHRSSKFYGNYLGIVIQNNDPAKRGRVKVWVPHVNAAVYENWDKVPKDKKFKFLGNNINSDINDILEDLKLLLPWADTAGPLMGATGSGRYNANLEVGTISDSAQPRTIIPREKTEEDKYPLNPDNIGEKPGHIYEIDKYKIHDAFNGGDKSGDRGQPNQLNKYSYSYIPKSHSNEAKGSFSIPNVGSHVWVFFNGGNHNSPVVFATSFGNEDWKGIYESRDNHGQDYPGVYENSSINDDSRYDHNTETYRNKYVLNQKGGTLEIVNTDNREILKLTHYSGSFKEFNNHSTIELCTGIDSKNVLSDSFLTIRGHRSEYAERDYDLITRGDFYHKIGDHKTEEYTEWKTIVREIADLKQLFDVKRASFDKSRNIYFQKTAPSQTKSGNPGPCPLCSASGREPMWDVTQNPVQQIIAPIFSTALGSGLGGSIAKLGMKFFASKISPFGPQPPFEYTQAPATPENFLGDGPCPLCNGTGLSPASEGGTWTQEGTNASGAPILGSDGKPVGKDGVVREKVDSVIGKLAEIEQKLGLGGSEIIDISKHKIETIGLILNDFPCIRIDEEGTASKSEVRIFKKGVVSNYTVSPVIEQVHVDDLPGGTYTLNVMNRLNCQVGAGGVSIKTLGHVDIGGAIMNIAGEQINIGSDNEVNIVANKINLVADILSLRNKKYKQVLVDSNLGVSQNVIVGGGMHVEGELTVQHITGPAQLNQSETVTVLGRTRENLPVGRVTGKATGIVTSGVGAGGTVEILGWDVVTVVGNGIPDTIECAPHQHGYKTVGMTMLQDSNSVREVGRANEMAQRIGPQPVENEDVSGILEDIVGDLGDQLPSID